MRRLRAQKSTAVVVRSKRVDLQSRRLLRPQSAFLPSIPSTKHPLSFYLVSHLSDPKIFGFPPCFFPKRIQRESRFTCHSPQKFPCVRIHAWDRIRPRRCKWRPRGKSLKRFHLTAPQCLFKFVFRHSK